jgi:hypothetical protein
MTSTFVLIVIIYSSAFGTTNVSMEHFNTMKSCEAAKYFIDQSMKDRGRDSSSVCLNEDDYNHGAISISDICGH